MQDVDRYISNFPSDIRERLNLIRFTFYEELPEVSETIRYNMPSFKVGTSHIYYAAYKKHISLHAIYGINEIEAKLALYRAKGTQDTLHFPHNKPIPFDLIKEIIRLKEKS